MKRHVVDWHSAGAKATQAPDPRFPNGIALDLARTGSHGWQQNCAVDLPYPAPECGHWLIRCQVCGFSTIVTAAGRPDDPFMVRLPCRPIVQ